MDVCSACNVDFYHNAEVRTLFSQVCDHRICEPCWRRLFHRGSAYSCPSCDARLRAEEWSELPREAKQLETETQIRRRIYEIYCKSEKDFPSSMEFDDYLEEREDIIQRLTNPASKKDAADAWQLVERCQLANAAEILQAKGEVQRKRAQKIHDIIAQEGTFCCSVNAEWTERERAPTTAASAAESGVSHSTPQKKHEHPFQVRYRDLLLLSDEGASTGGQGTTSDGWDHGTPYGAPQPMIGSGGFGYLSPMSPGCNQQDPVRQASGGGQLSGAGRRKARHYFFADLASAAARTAPAAKAVLAS